MRRNKRRNEEKKRSRKRGEAEARENSRQSTASKETRPQKEWVGSATKRSSNRPCAPVYSLRPFDVHHIAIAILDNRPTIFSEPFAFFSPHSRRSSLSAKKLFSLFCLCTWSRLLLFGPPFLGDQRCTTQYRYSLPRRVPDPGGEQL